MALADEMPPPGGVAERLLQTRFFSCSFAEGVVIPVVSRDTGTAMIDPGGRVIPKVDAGQRLVFVDGADMFQIAGSSSFAAVGGVLAQGTCTDITSPVLSAVALATGVELRAGMNAFEAGLLNQLSTAADEISRLRAAAAAEPAPFCEGALATLDFVARTLEVSPHPDLVEQARLNRMNAARLRDIIDRCS